MRNRFKLGSKMVQALTILSALQLFSEVPGADGTPDSYGINLDLVKGAARVGSSLNPQQQDPRELDLHPGVPALSQVSPLSASSNRDNGGGLNSKGQTLELPPCNVGKGVIRYERMTDIRRAPSSSDSDIIRLSEIPADVLFKCHTYCLKDETSNQGRKQLCGSLDFVPGKRYTSHQPTIEYTESKCFLIRPDQSRSQPPKYEVAKDFYHYREVCYSGTDNEESTTSKDCPERTHVMERVMGKRFMPKDIKEVNANSLEECEEICLNQAVEDPLMATSVCRSGTFDHQRHRCYLSTFTRRTHTNSFNDDPVYDYFENTCLNVERRCPLNKLFWTKEVNAEMTGPYDFQIYQNMTLQSCKSRCLNSKTIFCRSVEYDERLKTCVLSDEDSVSKPEHIKRSASDQNIYLELTCIDGYHLEPSNHLGNGFQQNLDRQQLTDRNLREVQTAFQLFRNRRLELSPGYREAGREGKLVSLAECLDACLEERTFQCRSAIYSRSHKSCKLSEFDQINGNLEFDPDFHYFENLMSSSRATSFGGGSSNFNSLDNNRFGFANNAFNDRFGGLGGNQGTNRFGVNDGNRFNQGQSTNSRLPFQSGGSSFSGGTGVPLSIGVTGTFQSGGSFSSGGSFGSGTANFGDRFGSNRHRGSSNNFGSSGGTFNNRGSNRERDKFSDAFDRFHEDNLGDRSSFTSNSRGSSSLFSGGNRLGNSGTRVTGVDLFSTGNRGGSSGGSVGFNRRGQSSSGGTRFTDRNSFGSGSRFGSADRNRFFSGSSGFGSGSSGFGSGGSSLSGGSFSSSGNTFQRPGFKFKWRVLQFQWKYLPTSRVQV